MSRLGDIIILLFVADIEHRYYAFTDERHFLFRYHLFCHAFFFASAVMLHMRHVRTR